MTSSARQQELLEACFDGLFSAEPVSRLIERAIRLAALRRDYANAWWLRLEAVGIDEQLALRSLDAEMKGHFATEEFDRRRLVVMRQSIELRAKGVRDFSKKADDRDQLPQPVGGLESLAAHLREQAKVLMPPPGMAPLDLYYAQGRYEKLAIPALDMVNDIEIVLDRIRRRIGQFLRETEAAMSLSALALTVFERLRAETDSRLSEFAPDLVVQFRAAYERSAASDDAEARSHALTTCRRIIKALADRLYPARAAGVVDVDGQSHPMTDAHYRNRLLQYVIEHSPGQHSLRLLEATIEELGTRLDAVDELASKGVHADVTTAEVDLCVAQAYLLVGDILRLPGLEGASNGS